MISHMAPDQKNSELDDNKYRAFLLRLWQVDVEETHAWRFSLEDPVTGERKGFAHIAKLMSFLMEEIDNDEPNRTNQLEDPKNTL